MYLLAIHSKDGLATSGERKYFQPHIPTVISRIAYFYVSEPSSETYLAKYLRYDLCLELFPLHIPNHRQLTSRSCVKPIRYIHEVNLRSTFRCVEPQCQRVEELRTPSGNSLNCKLPVEMVSYVW